MYAKQLIIFFLWISISSFAQTQRGQASYYKSIFEGKTTASGEIFQHEFNTAAHRTLPFGSIVQITNLSNGKTAYVRINDRGPYIVNRIIDVTQAVAAQLGFLQQGITNVEIEVVGTSEENPSASAYPTDAFSEVGQVESTLATKPDEDLTSMNAKETTALREATPEEKVKTYQTSQEISQTIENPVEEEKANPTAETSNVKNTTSTANATEVATKTSENVDHEVVNMVRTVSNASPKNEASKMVEAPLPNTMPATLEEKVETKQQPTKATTVNEENLIQRIESQVSALPGVEQLFDLQGEKQKNMAYAVQVVSLSDVKSATDLGIKLQDYYKEDIFVYYKIQDGNNLYSIAVGKASSRAEAEQLKQKVADRYPYAFILDFSK